MSTYNGEKYLREQIDSILGQRGVEVTLLVRDDGSSDATLSILDEYKSSGLLDYYCGSNLGPARSFMHLLQNAPASDFYAFSDQDDKWMDDKLLAAITSMEGHESEPALYFSQTQLVDAGLKKNTKRHNTPQADIRRVAHIQVHRRLYHGDEPPLA